MKDKVSIPRDTKFAVFILCILIAVFVAMNVFNVDNLKIGASSGGVVSNAKSFSDVVSSVAQPITDLAGNDFFSIVGLLFAFVILLLAIYLYEKKSLMAPIRGKHFPKKKVVKNEIKKVAKSSGSKSSFWSDLFGPSKRQSSSSVSSEDVFDAAADRVCRNIGKQGFDPVSASKDLGDKFKKLPLDVQERKLNRFFDDHRRLDRSFK